MIGKLSGVLDSAADGQLILDVGGVGYLVSCSPRTLSRCGQKGDPLSLYIDTHMREESLTLFGFLDQKEQHWFRLLYSVQGVGPKAAMAILGVCPPEQIGFAIASGDKAAITQAPGVGPKLAARIVTELKDKAAKMDIAPGRAAVTAGVFGAQEQESGIDHDAVSALVNLGYARSESFRAVLQAKEKAPEKSVNDNLQHLIKLALKELSL